MFLSSPQWQQQQQQQQQQQKATYTNQQPSPIPPSQQQQQQLYTPRPIQQVNYNTQQQYQPSPPNSPDTQQYRQHTPQQTNYNTQQQQQQTYYNTQQQLTLSSSSGEQQQTYRINRTQQTNYNVQQHQQTYYNVQQQQQPTPPNSPDTQQQQQPYRQHTPQQTFYNAQQQQQQQQQAVFNNQQSFPQQQQQQTYYNQKQAFLSNSSDSQQQPYRQYNTQKITYNTQQQQQQVACNNQQHIGYNNDICLFNQSPQGAQQGYESQITREEVSLPEKSKSYPESGQHTKDHTTGPHNFFPLQKPLFTQQDPPFTKRLRDLKALIEDKDQISVEKKKSLWKLIASSQPRMTRECLETFGLEVMNQLRKDDLEEAHRGTKLKIFKCVLNQLKMKIPDEYEDFEIYWGFFALMNIFDGETLKEVRDAYQNYLEVYFSTERMPIDDIINDPFTIPNRIHDLICDGMTKTEAYKIWDTEPYTISAGKITSALHAESLRYLGNTPERPLSLFRDKWGLFPEGCPNVSIEPVESFPPHLEVPVKYLYVPELIGKMIISVDLKKSGFEIMRLYDKRIVCGADSWKGFISIVMKGDPKIGCLESVGIDKFRGIRMRSLGKMYHEKSRALQSHALRMLVRAMVVYCMNNPKVDIGCIESVFKFSCDELIVVCSSATNPIIWKNAIRIVDGAMDILNIIKGISRMELIHLRAINYTPGMVRHFDDFKRKHSFSNCPPRREIMTYKHAITEEDEKWTEPHISRDTFDKIFIREKYWGSDDDPCRTYELLKTHTFSLKSLPKPIYVEGAIEVVKQLYPEWYAYN